jgi:hypothetical protein
MHLLENEPNFFLSFGLIIVSNVAPQVEEKLSELLWHSELYTLCDSNSQLPLPSASPTFPSCLSARQA